MDRVYIISRYTGKTPEEIKFNEQVCRYFCRQVAKQGKRPVAPHLFYTQFTDDNDPQEREQGLRFGIADLDECDEFLVSRRSYKPGNGRGINPYSETRKTKARAHGTAY